MLEQPSFVFSSEYSDPLEAVDQEYTFINLHTIRDATRIPFLDLAQLHQ
jgi:hypothetical protein